MVVERVMCLAIGYVCGCVLFAEVVARVLRGTSIFEQGNGNPGMANVARSLGPASAALCLAGDVGKVVVAVLVCRALFPALGAEAAGWAGVGATLGHDAPFWHGFRGGKGVAAIAATLYLSCWPAALVATGAAVATLLLSGYLSIAAVAGAAAFVVAVTLFHHSELMLVALALFALALAGQWTNLWGIRDGSATRDLRRH